MDASPPLDLERLFHEHQRDLLAMLRRMVRCQHTAADLAQEAYVRLAHLPASQIIASPRAFLFRTATNLALDHFRKERFRGRRQASLEETKEIPTDIPSAETQAYDKQRVATIEKVLATLSERSRSVFVLRRVYGYSYQEIAKQLGISERAVEKHLVKAMDRCQEAFLSPRRLPTRPGGKIHPDTSVG